MVLNIESFQRDVTSVAAPVTRDIQRKCFDLTGKRQNRFKMTVSEENDGGYKKVRVLLMKVSGLVLMTKKINGEINCVCSFLLRFTKEASRGNPPIGSRVKKC